MISFFNIRISDKPHASEVLQILNETFSDLEITETEKTSQFAQTSLFIKITAFWVAGIAQSV